MANSATSLIDLLQRQRLLKPAQLAELASLNGKPPAEVVKELVRRGWLTTFQGRQILAGKGDRLLFGPYVLLEQLGTGGSGQVFKARHIHMDRIVALKILRADLLQDTDAVGRFHREVEVLSHLHHSAIVHAYDAGEAGGTHFLAMEFIDGIDLERQIKEGGPLAVPLACEYLRQVAAGLQYAHERGLVHRDIKPSNLLVAPPGAHAPGSPGIVKILDLGLAKLREPVEGSKTKNLTVLAGSSVMMGTPDYMAPEQAIDFRTADIRADIYSLGCTFYFLLTGRPPYSGSLTVKLARHQQGDFAAVAVLEHHPALAELLRKMLARQPADRFQTPGEIVAALDRLKGGKSEPETAIDEITAFEPRFRLPGRPRRQLFIVAGGLLLLLGIGWLGLSTMSGPGTPPAVPPPPRYALQFNGKDQLVVLPDDLFRASPQLTVEAWFRTTAPGGILGYQHGAYPQSPGSYVPVLSIGVDHILRGQFWDHRSEPVASPVKVTDGRWHHAAVVSDGQTHRLYLDGEPIGSRTSGKLDHLTMSNNQLGASFTGGWPGNNGSWLHFNGQIAELRVWHVARSAEQIRRDRHRFWLFGQAGLAAWYAMLEPTSDGLRDYSGNQRHAKLGGDDPKRKPNWLTIKPEDAPAKEW